MGAGCINAITCTYLYVEKPRGEKKKGGFDRIEAQVSDMAVSLPSMHSWDKVMYRLLLHRAGVAVGLSWGELTALASRGNQPQGSALNQGKLVLRALSHLSSCTIPFPIYIPCSVTIVKNSANYVSTTVFSAPCR